MQESQRGSGRSRRRTTAPTPAPTDDFGRACTAAGVAPEDRAALWRLHCGVPSASGGAVRWSVEDLIADYGLWRVYQSARQGDAAAARDFEAYWRKYLKGFCDSRWPRELVDELSARFFERTWRLVGEQFQWGCPFSVYLKTLLLNLSRDLRARLARERQRQRSLDSTDELAERLSAREPSPEAKLLSDEDASALRRALNELEPADRHVLLACVVDDRPGQDVATELGIERNALYQRLHRAKERLRARFAASGLLDPPPAAATPKDAAGERSEGGRRVRSGGPAGPVTSKSPMSPALAAKGRTAARRGGGKDPK